VYTKLQKNITLAFLIWLPKVLRRLPKAIMSSQTLGNYMEKKDQTFIVSLFSQWLASILAAFFFSSEILPKREIKKLKIENEVIY
jgi:hypothetical protein